ncbi:hypothetical protein FE257_010482 [Aspergillus nanangensis]|uniref:Uncharacterized protein n=1 Tax=Aspergillus nanangensis TaxID=2582783 RepID=A0AAD4CIW6_ASPNN|nr:hypothetical protein FE257_010482 [Aspergillus nanangensis]
MGQGHSTNTRETSDTKEIDIEKKVDYYELLGVERGTSGEEIKKAYRRKALELHPDRNFGNVESATKLFAEIQSAYEVLSDPQERAWYDSHREAFLGSDVTGGETNYSYDTRMTTADDVLKLFSRFSPRMEFSDSEDGFYGGLRETFSRLALEEKTACYWENIEYAEYPTFGSCDDNFVAVVRPFYAVWSNFSTKKSFAWKDNYRYSDAPDRRVRRLMEKENKHLREEGIRQFNEAVRSLVAFVKKRDPRYKANAQTEVERQELLRQTAAAQAVRSRAVNEAKLRDHIVQDWAKSDYHDEEHSDESENETEHFECVACHKSFKSHNQFEAHERSKKHIKAVKQLRWEMKKESEQLGLGGDFSNLAGSFQEDPSIEPCSRAGSPLERDQRDDFLVNIEHEHGPDATSKYDTREFLESDASDHCAMDASSAETVCAEDVKGADVVEDYAPRESVENRLFSLSISTPDKPGITSDPLAQVTTASEPEEPSLSSSKKIGKAKQKRAKKAQRSTTESPSMTCTVCHSSFPSRTQLFSHIRDYGHAEPLTKGSKTKK